MCVCVCVLRVACCCGLKGAPGRSVMRAPGRCQTRSVWCARACVPPAASAHLQRRQQLVVCLVLEQALERLHVRRRGALDDARAVAVGRAHTRTRSRRAGTCQPAARAHAQVRGAAAAQPPLPRPHALSTTHAHITHGAQHAPPRDARLCELHVCQLWRQVQREVDGRQLPRALGGRQRLVVLLAQRLHLVARVVCGAVRAVWSTHPHTPTHTHTHVCACCQCS
jgi:hypothetical protein